MAKYFWIKSYEPYFEAVLRIGGNKSTVTIKVVQIENNTVGKSSVGCFPINEIPEDTIGIDYLITKIGFEHSIDWIGEITKEDYEELTR